MEGDDKGEGVNKWTVAVTPESDQYIIIWEEVQVLPWNNLVFQWQEKQP